MNKTFGFIMLRHVCNDKTNNYWIECYDSIRKFYPDNYIIIIDNDSSCEFITNKYLHNVTIINSEFKGRGELLPYYYYLNNKFFDIAFIVQDSIIFNECIEINDDVCKFIWNFKHNWDNIEDEIYILNAFNDINLINFYNDKKLWNGCFGSMCIISHDALKNIDDKYNIKILLNYITNKKYRCCFERIIACLICICTDVQVLFGDLHIYFNGFGHITYDNKNNFNHLPIVKYWSGR